jgi:peptidoglycan/LPS O-acetylase OafA/YrhL
VSTEPTAPVTGTRKRLDHIDAMRPVKQAAVISTHALIFFAPPGVTVVGLLMLTRFSRDAFLFVSACMLTYSYKDSQKMQLSHYAKRRFISVGVPYLAWTVIYTFYTALRGVQGFPFYKLIPSRGFNQSGFDRFVHLLSTGYYHLYYLIVIMEFYVLFPLILVFVRKHARWHAWIMGAAVLWQIVYGLLLGSKLLHWNHVIQSRLIISYPVYLIGGVIVALHLDPIHDWIVEHGWAIVLWTLGAVALAELLMYGGIHGVVPNYLATGNRVFAATVVPFNVGAILCVYLLGVFLVSPRRSLRTRAMVQSGSDNSYGVYLSQLLWIPFLIRLRYHFHIHLPWGVEVPLALIIVYAMGFVFTALVARTPLAKAVTGRSRASWRSLLPKRVETPESLHEDTGSGPLDLVEE